MSVSHELSSLPVALAGAKERMDDEEIRNEVFIGALPRSPASMAAVEAGLHEALMKFAGATEPSAVKIRLHTRASGEGRGFGFAWLPDQRSAERLVELSEIFYNFDGHQMRAGIRAARGVDPTRRPPPSSEQGGRLSITMLALSSSHDCSSILACFTVWQEILKRFGIGLDVDLFTTTQQLERCHYSDVVLLLERKDDENLSQEQIEEWMTRAQKMADAGRTVLVVEMECSDSNGKQAESLPAKRSLSSSIKAAGAEEESKGRFVVNRSIQRIDVVTAEELSLMYPWKTVQQPTLSTLGDAREAASLSTLATRRAVARQVSSMYKVHIHIYRHTDLCYVCIYIYIYVGREGHLHLRREQYMKRPAARRARRAGRDGLAPSQVGRVVRLGVGHGEVVGRSVQQSLRAQRGRRVALCIVVEFLPAVLRREARRAGGSAAHGGGAKKPVVDEHAGAFM